MTTPTNPQADNQLPPVICGACNTKFTGETAIKQCQDHIKAEHTVEPEQSSNSELLKILDKYRVETEDLWEQFMEGADPDPQQYDDFLDNATKEATTAILANYTPNSEVDKIVEAVIGDDLLPPIDDREWDYVKHTNQLRAEQRKRYEALKRGEEQS